MAQDEFRLAKEILGMRQAGAGWAEIARVLAVEGHQPPAPDTKWSDYTVAKAMTDGLRGNDPSHIFGELADKWDDRSDIEKWEDGDTGQE